MSGVQPELPSSHLRRWVTNHDFVVARGSVYVLFPPSMDRRDVLQFGSTNFGLEYGGTVRERFDEAYARAHAGTLKGLLGQGIADTVRQQGRQVEQPLRVSRDLDVVRMIMCNVIPRYHHPGLQLQSAEEVPTPASPPLDVLVDGLRGSAHPLETVDFSVFRGSASRLRRSRVMDSTLGAYIDGQSYSFQPGVLDLEKLTEDYESELAASFESIVERQAEAVMPRVLQTDRQLLSCVQAGGYEDAQGVGFERRGDTYYVYMRLSSFALYEEREGAYYQFPSTRVAVPLSPENGELRWHDPVVLDQFTHPLLPAVERPHQAICTGPAQEGYSRMRQELRQDPGLLPVQVAYVLRDGVRLLTESYSGDQDTIVHKAIYKHPDVYGQWCVSSPYNVTNV